MIRLASLAGLLAACTAEPGQLAQPVVGGSEGGPPAVVGLLADGELFCSGVMVTRRVLLTAAHCAAVVPAGARVDAHFGDRIDDGGETLEVVDLVHHPDWRPDALPDDIAVGALADDGPAPPIARSIHPLGEADLGSLVAVVGFGRATAGGDDQGVKRSGAVAIAGFDDRRLALAPGPPATCNGDSGGPVVRTVNGVLEVIGVHSRSSCDDLSLEERVDAHADFIDPFVASHPAGCDEPCDGGCAAGGGAGSSAVVIVLLGLALRPAQRRALLRRCGEAVARVSRRARLVDALIRP